MKLSTRFGIGAAIAVLPLLGLIGFSLERMQSLARNNERLTERTAIASQVRVGILARLERIDEYSRKHTISKDAGYAQLLATTITAVSDELAQLGTLDLSDGECVALSRLQQEFQRFADHTSAALASRAALPTAVERREVVTRAEEFQVSTRAAGEAEAVAARRTRAHTRRTAVIVAIVALVSSAIALLMTLRALRSRLREFIRATELVSRGKFWLQLDSSRDDELDRTAAAFNQMVDALGELDRIKADFVSSISHELRTPLVAMQETTNLLLDEVLGPLNERQRKLLVLNVDAGRRLSRMIGDLLDLSVVRAGLECAEDLDLVRLTWIAVSQLEALALEREIELRSELAAEDLVARCDADRFVQVVQNLIENALKYTPRGGVITVTLARHAQSGREWALLQVEDSGPGIPEPDRERVFEKFFRHEGLASDGGAGLGLAICREIVEAHGGSVWVDDAPSLGGAALKVALPLTQGAT